MSGRWFGVGQTSLRQIGQCTEISAIDYEHKRIVPVVV